MTIHGAIRRCGAACVALLVTGLAACDFIETDLNNPNAVPDATTDQLARLASIWTQQMAGTDRQFAILDQYIFTEEEADGEFAALYTGGGLVDLRNAIGRAAEAGDPLYAGILKIHEAFLIGMGASIFGDIPYTEAVNPEIAEPGLDSQASVYAAVQALLDEALADLAAGGTGPGGADMNFAGDPAAWTAVANTLKARFHLHWAEVNGAPAYESARTAALAGISTPEGNWRAVHSASAPEQNLWAQFMRDRSGYISGGDFLIPLMVDDGDPRLPLYFEPVDGAFVPRASTLSSSGFGAVDFDIPILTCAENNFILAEASVRLGDEAGARTAADAALTCQELEYGVDLGAQKAALGGLSGDALATEILLQKYTALFLNMEVWNDYKRTCVPAITPRAASGVPGRLFYGQSERQTNRNIPEPAQQPARNPNDPNPC